MKFISTKTHGYIDYVTALVLWFAPTIFAFENIGGPAVWIPRILAVVVLLQSLATDYELGVVKAIPMKAHLMMDYVASLFLAVSPFLFDFSRFDANVWMPHVVAGVGYFLISLMTDAKSRRYSPAHR